MGASKQSQPAERAEASDRSLERMVIAVARLGVAAIISIGAIGSLILCALLVAMYFDCWPAPAIAVAMGAVAVGSIASVLMVGSWVRRQLRGESSNGEHSNTPTPRP